MSRANNAYIGFLALTLIATVLIVVFNNRLNKAKDSTAIREKQQSDEKVAALTKEAEIAKKERSETDLKAETARESASKAEEKAGEIEKQNIQLRTDLETATAESRAKQAELAKQQGSLATEQRKTAEAQRQTAEAQLALKKYAEQVEERRQPRHFTAEQRARFIDKLRNAPKVVVTIICGNDEACVFAKEIASALREAGYTDVRGGDGAVMSVLTPFVGMRLVQRHQGDAMPYTQALFEAFELAGVTPDPRFDERGEVAENECRLIIGTKP